MVLSPGGLVIVACLPLVGILMRKTQPRFLVIFGVLVSAAGLFLMARFTLGIDFRTAVWSRIVQSLGMAFLFVPISAAAFAYIPKERTNYATGLFNLARNIGGSCGIATATTLLARRAQFHQSVLVSHASPFNPRYRDAVAGITAALHNGGMSPPDAAAKAHAVLYGSIQRQSGMLAFADTFWVMGVLFLLIVPLMFFMRNTRPVQGPVVVE
jgi:DHA2 family multidrug resistance protein